MRLNTDLLVKHSGVYKSRLTAGVARDERL